MVDLIDFVGDRFIGGLLLLDIAFWLNPSFHGWLNSFFSFSWFSLAVFVNPELLGGHCSAEYYSPEDFHMWREEEQH